MIYGSNYEMEYGKSIPKNCVGAIKKTLKDYMETYKTLDQRNKYIFDLVDEFFKIFDKKNAKIKDTLNAEEDLATTLKQGFENGLNTSNITDQLLDAAVSQLRIEEGVEINESKLNEEKFNGIDINPGAFNLKKKDFGKTIKSISELVTDKMYIIWEPGMNEWVGDYTLIKIGSKSLEFKLEDGSPRGGGEPVEFDVDEINDYIKDGQVIERK